jgi:hypothetical protein
MYGCEVTVKLIRVGLRALDYAESELARRPRNAAIVGNAAELLELSELYAHPAHSYDGRGANGCFRVLLTR